MPLRFHWSLSSAGAHLRGATARAAQSGTPDLGAHIAFCRHAEACGIQSLLTAFGFHRPDPLVLAAALGGATETITFMVACRPGVASPTFFVQQINTLAALTQGRVCLNMVAGHTPQEQRFYGDFLSHEARYQRMDEFLTVCRALWAGEDTVTFHGTHYQIDQAVLNTPFVSPHRRTPEIFLGGSSPEALNLAVKHASCLLTLPDIPERLAPRLAPVLAQGTEVGLLVSLIARPTRAEALQAAAALLAPIRTQARSVHSAFARGSDSVAFTSVLALADTQASEWLTHTLWLGAIPYLGAPAIALVGSFDEVAETMLTYASLGITQFLCMGWPDLTEMTLFSQEVLPLVQQHESQTMGTQPRHGVATAA